MSKKGYVSVDRLFNMTLFDDEYYREWIKQDLIDMMDKTHDAFIIDDGELYCDMNGCRDVLGRINRDEDEYMDALSYISKYDESDTTVNTQVAGSVNSKNVDEETIKRYMRRICLGISTNGYCLPDEDLNLLNEKDKMTINNSFKVYNDSIREGNIRNSINLPKVYDYVDKNDPDICRRMLYYYDYDKAELGDFLDRYNYMDYKAIRKAITKSFRKDKKKHEKKNKKKNKKYRK